MAPVATTEKKAAAGQKTAAKKPAVKAAVSSDAPQKTPSKAKKQDNETFAVIETGGKQYVVAEGDTISIEKLKGEHKEGETIVFDKVLLVDDGKDATIGTPYIDGAKVEGKLEKEGRHKKISVIHFRSKSRHFKKQGHRQPYMRVSITAVK